MCSILGGWGSTTRRGRGVNSRRRSRVRQDETGALLAARRGTPVATARHGVASVNRSRRPAWCDRPARCPTRSCTVTRTSRSSMAPRTPRSWPPRPPGSGWRRWRSPTTTASTAWSASPRRPRRSVSPPCSAPRSPCRRRWGHRRMLASPDRRPTRSARSPPVRCPTHTHPIRPAPTCSCSPMARLATPACRVH